MKGVGGTCIAPVVVGPFCPSGVPVCASRSLGAGFGTGTGCGGITVCAPADVAVVATDTAIATHLTGKWDRSAIRFFWISVNAPSRHSHLLSCFKSRRVSFFREKRKQ